MEATVDKSVKREFRFVVTEKADSLLCLHEEYLLHLNVKSCPDFVGVLNRVMSAKSLTNADLAAAQRIMLKNILSITHNPLENSLLLRLRPDCSRTKFFALGIENGDFVRELVERCGLSGPKRRRASLLEFSTSQNSILMLVLGAVAGLLVWGLLGWEEEAASAPGAGILNKMVALLVGLVGNAAIVLCSAVLVGVLGYWIWSFKKHPELTGYSRSTQQGSLENEQ